MHFATNYSFRWSITLNLRLTMYMIHYLFKLTENIINSNEIFNIIHATLCVFVEGLSLIPTTHHFFFGLMRAASHRGNKKVKCG